MYLLGMMKEKLSKKIESLGRKDTEMLGWEKSVKQIKDTMQTITRFTGIWLRHFLGE